MVGLHHLALSSLLLAAPIAALYDKADSKVVMLNAKNFESTLQNVHKTAIVEFFAPWCGHCQKLAKDYERAAKDLKGFADVFAVNCDEDENKKLCDEQKIKGFPTLKLVKPNDDRSKKYMIKEYKGSRKIKDIVSAVLTGLYGKIDRLTTDNFEEWLEKDNSTAKTLLFSDKGATPALYKALKVDFGDRIKMAMVRDKEEEVLKYFNVEKVPHFVFLPGGTHDGIVFAEKKMDRDHVYKWLRKYVQPVLDPDVHPFDRAKKYKFDDVKKDETIDEKKEDKKEDKKEEKAAEPEPSNIVWLIPGLSDTTALQQACFTPLSKTCILGFSETADKLDDPTLEAFKTTHDFYRAHHPGVARFYKIAVNSDAGKWVREQLGLSEKNVITAVNGHRKWFRVYSGENTAAAVESWVDEIRLGDAAKEKLPAGLIVEVSNDEPTIPDEAKKPEVKEEEEKLKQEAEQHDEL